jgi:VIT1/CCC1 family predicted Fe2+/Mn2+ transporter
MQSARVKEAIEEMIEESYLLGLSEQEIRQDFKRFIDTCYAVIHDHIRDRSVVSGLAESLAREKTVLLIADRAEGMVADLEMGDEGIIKSPSEVFAEKVARRKRQILKAIAQHDPQLVRLIDAQRFQGDVREPVRPRFRPPWRSRCRPDWERLRLQLLRIGYATTVALILVLVYLGFARQP